MSDLRQVEGGRLAIGDIAPKLATLTDEMLLDDVWNRCRALENGVTHSELVEAITHLAFYDGWPNAMSAATIAREVFDTTGADAR
jgi:4-carboxymuconolactone decarboxylase